MEWTLRPAWQRAGLCAIHVVAGAFFAGALLGMKAQVIRSITILPSKAASASAAAPKPTLPSGKTQPPPDLRTVVIQNASDSKNTGYGFSFRSMWLEEGREKSELMLRSKEVNGRWYLNMDGAVINGKKTSTLDEARGLFINHWEELQGPPAPAKSSPKRS